MKERNLPMRSSSSSLAILARRPGRFVAFACVVFLLSGSCANAGTVLQFGQFSATDVVTATDSAGVTTLSTAGNADGFFVSIPVTITNFLGVPGLSIPAYETFVGVTSTAPASMFMGLDIQPFAGTIEFTFGPGGIGPNFLTATFANVGAATNSLRGSDGGSAATLSAAEPPASVILTSDFALFGPPTSAGIGFSNVSPALAISPDGSIAGFTAQNAGTFSATIIPEPASFALLGIGMSTLLAFRRLFKGTAGA
jgi:hypothetical protein